MSDSLFLGCALPLKIFMSALHPTDEHTSLYLCPLHLCHPHHPLCLLSYWITSSFSLPLFVCHLHHPLYSPLSSLGTSICPSKNKKNKKSWFSVVSLILWWWFPTFVSKIIVSSDLHFCSLLGTICCLESRSTSWSSTHVFTISRLYFLICYARINSKAVARLWSCDVQNAKWKETTTKSSAKLLRNGKKVLPGAEGHFKQ